MADIETIKPIRWKRWKLVLLCGLIFVSGIFTGSGMMVYALHTRMEIILSAPEKLTEAATNYLTHRLHLRDDQAAGVKDIIGEHHRNIMEKRHSIMPYIQDEMELIRDEVAVVLDEEQKEIWLKRFEQMHRGWAPVPPDLLPVPEPPTP